jgi:hypothetical protein
MDIFANGAYFRVSASFIVIIIINIINIIIISKLAVKKYGVDIK